MYNSDILVFFSNTEKNDLCFSPYESTCTGEDAENYSYYGAVVIFFVSQFFVGIAISVFFTIGVTYLDDNISKKTYPIYYGKHHHKEKSQNSASETNTLLMLPRTDITPRLFFAPGIKTPFLAR